MKLMPEMVLDIRVRDHSIATTTTRYSPLAMMSTLRCRLGANCSSEPFRIKMILSRENARITATMMAEAVYVLTLQIVILLCAVCAF